MRCEVFSSLTFTFVLKLEVMVNYFGKKTHQLGTGGEFYSNKGSNFAPRVQPKVGLVQYLISQ
jgi:hypothetical protein